MLQMVKLLYLRSLGTQDFLVHNSVFYISHVNFIHNFTEVSSFMCKILSMRVHLFVLCGFVPLAEVVAQCIQ
jgi:hypothetical protein